MKSASWPAAVLLCCRIPDLEWTPELSPPKSMATFTSASDYLDPRMTLCTLCTILEYLDPQADEATLEGVAACLAATPCLLSRCVEMLRWRDVVRGGFFRTSVAVGGCCHS